MSEKECHSVCNIFTSTLYICSIHYAFAQNITYHINEVIKSVSAYNFSMARGENRNMRIAVIFIILFAHTQSQTNNSSCCASLENSHRLLELNTQVLQVKVQHLQNKNRELETKNAQLESRLDNLAKETNQKNMGKSA